MAARASVLAGASAGSPSCAAAIGRSIERDHMSPDGFSAASAGGAAATAAAQPASAAVAAARREERMRCLGEKRDMDRYDPAGCSFLPGIRSR